jgi:hypothetical protein
VEGPACKIKETEGLFSFYASVDWYETGLTRRPVGSGPSAPDPTAGVVRTCPMKDQMATREGGSE